MKPTEACVAFDCVGDRMLGIVSLPGNGASNHTDIGVVIIVGGPQYRAGSHRQFVMLARHLAASGHPTLRFDCRGMGDSSGAPRNFESFSNDIGAAVDALQRAAPTVQRVVLWGLCDAASAALLYGDENADPRVAGLALLNPWVRSEASLARTQVKHYYRQRLMQRAFWKKLLSGGVAVGAVTGLASNLRAAAGRTSTAGSAASTASYQDRMARAWQAFDRPVLLMLSDDDYTAREFDEYTTADARWRAALREHPPKRVPIAGADHTCSAPEAQRAAEVATSTWLQEAFARAEVPAP
ncbi:MAG: hydrolase 1, exosortase A system-associated [Pseudomonadota bacterium]|nr:hydrolase 1, exosortase A system-associated [Pseudomonadota bacterium]